MARPLWLLAVPLLTACAAGRAAMVSEHADGYGWVFGTVSVLGTILGSALGTMRDAQILDVQQTVAAGALLPMTNGRTWEIRIRRGDLSLSGASDLRLTMESWGCADVRGGALSTPPFKFAIGCADPGG